MAPQPAPVPPTQAKKSNTALKSCLSCLTIVVVFVLLIVGYSGVRFFLDRSAYERAHAARAEARCEEAISGYDGLISGFRLADFGDLEALAKAEREECNQFVASTTSQSAGEFSDALFNYQSLVQAYPGSPLVAPAQSRMTEILSGSPGSALAGETFCTGLDSLAITANLPGSSPAVPGLLNACGDFYQQKGNEAGAFEQYVRVLNEFPASPEVASAGQSLQASSYACDLSDDVLAIPALAGSGDYLPTFLNSCGQRYEDSGDYGEATRVYQAFLDHFPGHALSEAVTEAYARSAIAYARDLGAGEIPAPSQVGGEAGATTVVVIQNDSPNRLRIVMTGPETRIEEIEPCPDCTT